MKRIKINTNVFNIVKRIKQINENFFVCFNLTTKKYEIHNKSNKNTFCYTVPFNQLDYRVLPYLIKNLKKSAKEIFLEIEENNQKIEKQNVNKIKDYANWQIKEIISYANSNSKDIKENDLNSNWV